MPKNSRQSVLLQRMEQKHRLFEKSKEKLFEKKKIKNFQIPIPGSCRKIF